MKKLLHSATSLVITALVLTLCILLLPNSAQAATYGKLTYTVNDGKVTITHSKNTGKLIIPDTIKGYPVTSIGNYAFTLSGVTSVTIPDSVTSIGEGAFSECYSLTSVTIGDSVTSIGESAFSACFDLTSVAIGDGVTSIGEYAFSDCDSLTVVTIPDSVTSIGTGAFAGCASLTSLTIPDSVTSIGNYVGYHCSRLTGIWVNENNRNYSSDSYGVLFNKDKTTLIQSPGTISGCYSIPNSVTSIANGAFSDCDSLTSVIIPDSVTSIVDGAFSNCSGLTGIWVNENNRNYSSDSYGVLFNKDKTTLIQTPGAISGSYFIPDSVTNIVGGAFFGCESLTDVYYTGTEAQWALIDIEFGNDDLLNATLHTGYVPIIIKEQPVGAYVVAGKKVKYTVKATGSNLTYQWQYRASSCANWKDTTATGCKTATLSLSATASRNGYQYRCKITDSSGVKSYTNAVNLIVFGIKTQPANKYLPAGKTAKFTVKASGTGLKYQWQYRTSAKGSWKAASATGNKTATLSVPATATRNGYQYRCKITDKYGNVIYSSAATLKIVTLKITAQPSSVTLAKGKTATFKVVAKGTGLKYQWQYRKNAKGAWKKATNTGNKTATLKVPVTAARNGYQYRCVITDKYGNVINSNAATLKVKK